MFRLKAVGSGFRESSTAFRVCRSVPQDLGRCGFGMVRVRECKVGEQCLHGK